VVLAGFYRTISCVVNAFGLEHEDGAPHYPPKTLP
jgi:hypothetical protein